MKTLDSRLEQAVILAGGKSTRMGRDKAFVELGGETLICRVVRMLAPVFDAVGIAAADSRQIDRLSRALAGAGEPEPACRVDFVQDLEPGRGPLEGVRSALTGIVDTSAFFVAVDAPLISPALVRLLWQRAAMPGARGAMPTWRRGVEPAHAVYSKSLLADVDAAMESEDRSLRQIAGWQGLVRVDLEDPEVESSLGGADPSTLFDTVNTPEDVTRIEKLLRSSV